MAKVLYIEDEIAKNISTIIKFFRPILNDKRITNKLKDLENSDLLNPQDIIDACRYNSSLDIAYNFPDALEKIIKNHQNYDLFIIDRNLSLFPYDKDLERIFNLLEKYDYKSIDEIKEYYEREGDLLLCLLLKLNSDYQKIIYFLTANTNDGLRVLDDMKSLIRSGNFNEEHIIEKGSENEEKIGIILSDLKSFKIQNQYPKQCEILRKHLDEDIVKQYINMIKDKEANKDKWKDYLSKLRNILENILLDIAYNLKEPNAEYWNKKYKNELIINKFISNDGLSNYNKRNNIGYNSIIKNACYSIYGISSEFGIHNISKEVDIENINTYNLTNNTVNSLLYQFNDVVLWYDKVLDIIQKQ
ncbi:MAG TPA: hypothetical protein PLG69_01615 [Candidatus Cloacimonas acidaminovorans]|jgi:hypothetical protein|nr:hypothetical protein [Candidatus Cloacimonas sp.]HPI42238.1 hypothetical protein [Candidatus Cloacimonas acidaminovorans]